MRRTELLQEIRKMQFGEDLRELAGQVKLDSSPMPTIRGGFASKGTRETHEKIRAYISMNHQDERICKWGPLPGFGYDRPNPLFNEPPKPNNALFPKVSARDAPLLR